MNTMIYLIGAIAIVGILYIFIKVFGGTYLKFRGTRVVTCPETQKPVAVEVNAKDAAIAVTLGHPAIHLRECTRWPERQNCGQECLKQIETNPMDCLFKTIIKNWYEGKSCAYCHKPIGEISWADYKPALLSPEKKTIDWSDIAPEEVYDVLSTHKPVCFDCHVAETFRRQYPGLVTNITPQEQESRVKISQSQ
jgi:hypothetical protein